MSNITERRQDFGLLSQPTLRELSDTIRFVVPQSDRDFSRPKEPFMAQSIPNDVAMVDDAPKDIEFIKNVQTFMKTGPLGASYLGPIDGKINIGLLNSIMGLEAKLEEKFNKPVIGTIIIGNSISGSGFSKAQSLLGINKLDKKTSNELIKSFQEFFSTAHPIIGLLYNGPKNGIINDELIMAVRKTEDKIAEAIDSKTVKGMILSGKTFKTTPSDVESALNLILKHKKNKLSSDCRFISFNIIKTSLNEQQYKEVARSKFKREPTEAEVAEVKRQLQEMQTEVRPTSMGAGKGLSDAAMRILLQNLERLRKRRQKSKI